VVGVVEYFLHVNNGLKIAMFNKIRSTCAQALFLLSLSLPLSLYLCGKKKLSPVRNSVFRRKNVKARTMAVAPAGLVVPCTEEGQPSYKAAKCALHSYTAMAWADRAIYKTFAKLSAVATGNPLGLFLTIFGEKASDAVFEKAKNLVMNPNFRPLIRTPYLPAITRVEYPSSGTLVCKTTSILYTSFSGMAQI
jgi:hypothetical protein